MNTSKTQIVDKPADAETELAALGLTVEIVKKIARQARSAKMETLPIDPVNSPGTQSYTYGVRAIRRALLRRKGWRMSRKGNIEATVNDKLGIQVVFQNVDLACDIRDPASISKKGSGSRRLIRSGNQGELFEGNQPRRLGKIGVLPRVWLICVSSDENSLQVEVSAPLNFDGNNFDGFAKRIFVSNERFDPQIKVSGDNNDSGGPEIEVVVNKK